MPATSDTGSQKYWFQGLAAEGLFKVDQGTQAYWFKGLAEGFLFPPVVTTTTTVEVPFTKRRNPGVYSPGPAHY